MPFYVIRQDICKMETDAVVNAANEDLLMGGGVCGAIFSAAGAEKLQAACDKIGHVDTGKAVITPAFALPSKYVIHTAGPIYRGGKNGEKELLRSCYLSSMKLAEKNGLSSIAFPLISSGIYGYPKKEAFDTASEAIVEFLENSEMTVYLLLFNTKGIREISAELKSYIDDNYVSKTEEIFQRGRDGHRWLAESRGILPRASKMEEKGGMKSFRSLEDLIKLKEEDFSHMLFRLIDERGLKDPEVYKRANLDRKLFSKIRCDKNYKPSKNTALALAISLKLSVDETLDLLKTAGYTLSGSSVTDLIVRYHIERGIYDIYEINFILFDYNEDPLGGKKMSF